MASSGEPATATGMTDARTNSVAMAAWRAIGTLSHVCGSPMAIGLAYHGSTADTLGGIDNLFGKHIDASTLDRHLATIGRHFNVVRLGDVAECLGTGRPLPRRAVFLTFDDGYAGNYEVAFPILRRYGFPATFFVPSAFVGTAQILPLDVLDSAVKSTTHRTLPANPHLGITALSLDSPEARCRAAIELRRHYKILAPPQDQEFLLRVIDALGFPGMDKVPPMGQHVRLMDWVQVSDMARQGMEIGSHTHRHRILARISRTEAQRELAESKASIERHGRTECRLFCYPNGNYPQDGNEETNRLARDAGYRGAVYMYGGINTRKTDPYRIARYSVGLDTPAMTLARYLASPRPRLGYLLGRP